MTSGLSTSCEVRTAELNGDLATLHTCSLSREAADCNAVFDSGVYRDSAVRRTVTDRVHLALAPHDAMPSMGQSAGSAIAHAVLVAGLEQQCTDRRRDATCDACLVTTGWKPSMSIARNATEPLCSISSSALPLSRCSLSLSLCGALKRHFVPWHDRPHQALQIKQTQLPSATAACVDCGICSEQRGDVCACCGRPVHRSSPSEQ